MKSVFKLTRNAVSLRSTDKTKIPKLRKPDDMTLEQWQIALRKEFSEEQIFHFKNVGLNPIFSEFSVTNPKTQGHYQVAIRGRDPGDNYCSCPDFVVNTLGTCKHVEFVLSRLGRKKGANALFARGFHPRLSEVHLRYGGKREVIFRPAKDLPSALRGFVSQYFDVHGILLPHSYSCFEEFLSGMRTHGQDVRCFDDVINFIAQVRDRAHLKARIERAFPRGIESSGFETLLKTQLYPYQKEGALFAATAGRTLIADDMGLGKTIQAISASEILARFGAVERVLVVSPTSLKHQWKQEIQKFSNRSVEVVEGLLAKRAALYRLESFYKITNYDVIHRDKELIGKWGPDLIILDEAQRIKNWKTRTAQNVKKLSSQFAIVLTGTPLENRLEDLHSIVEFVDRFRLGPTFRYLAEHQVLDEFGKVVGYHNLSKIKETLKPILIRRTKDEVLKDLPERLEKSFFVPMTKQQMQHHEENREIVARIVHKWRRFRFLSESDQRFLMIALQRMRMSCNSTYLLDPNTDFGVKADELISLLSDIFEDKSTKAVIFSQWLGTHEVIVRRIKARGWDHVFFHGSVESRQRGKLISRFKEDPECRLFLSTDAGGVGLNLQNASVVINMDQPWNPAVLEQRIGRVHRLGQHLPVRVIHFISQGTIEHGMLQLLAFKKSMFSGVLDGGQDEVFLGKSRLNRFMESIEKVSSSIPKPMPQQSPKSTPEDETKQINTEVATQSAVGEQWREVMSAGLSFVDKLKHALETGHSQNPQNGGTPSLICRNKAGKPYLQIPMPPAGTLKTMADMLTSMAKLF